MMNDIIAVGMFLIPGIFIGLLISTLFKSNHFTIRKE